MQDGSGNTHDGVKDELTKMAVSKDISDQNVEEVFENAPQDDIEQNPVNIQYSDPELQEKQKEERKRQEAERAEALEKELGL